MASQTGTLKFRQSDGTYTELYPKTTIAQVDGLQTQLDSINTSLQNKVGFNTDTTLKHIHVSAIDSQGRLLFIQESRLSDDYNSKATVSFSDSGLYLYFYNSKTNDTKYNRLQLDTQTLRMYSTMGDTPKEEYFATQSYVTNAISGAIAASY